MRVTVNLTVQLRELHLNVKFIEINCKIYNSVDHVQGADITKYPDFRVGVNTNFLKFQDFHCNKFPKVFKDWTVQCVHV